MIDESLRSLVRDQTGNLCEYCRLPQAASRFVRVHVEHVVLRQRGGSTEPGNLALACSFCNFHKGPNSDGLDPETRQLTRLLHPRRDEWPEHFRWLDTVVAGITPIDRATATLLAMNDWQRVELRGGVLSKPPRVSIPSIL